MVPVVRHGHRLGEALRLVVDAPEADGVHVPPVRLGLGVDEGIAVDLGGGGQEEAGTLLLGDAQGVVGPQAPHLQRLDGELQIVHRARRRSEVEDAVYVLVDEEGLGDVVLDEPETLEALQERRVVPGAGDEVVDTDDLVVVGEEALGEV